MDAEYFDSWYADMGEDAANIRFTQQQLGLPADLESTSLLSMSGLLEVRELLSLRPGQVLVDLACGRGGYGLWLARDTGCSVIGVDFSAVAIEQARQAADRFALSDRATFAVGDLEAAGLDDQVADAVLSVDALQFAGDPTKAAAEMLRMLRPGGRAVITNWEARDRDDAAMPDRFRALDVESAMIAAGFADVVIHDRPEWIEIERRKWTAAQDLDPAGDASLTSLKNEAGRILPIIDDLRRILAIGVRPG